jgi:acetoin utilization protein AcuB
MQIDKLMSRDVRTIGAGESCHEAVAHMAQRRIRHLPVVDSADRLVGIVTDRDLRHRLFTPDVFRQVGAVPVEKMLKGITVREVMSTPVSTVSRGDDVEIAARLMLERKLGSLPVVEAGRVVGIVTETDLLRHIVKGDACCADVETIVVSYP